MGYTTDFTGAFYFDKPVDEKMKEFINQFSCTRRMKRDNNKIKQIYPNWIEKCFNGMLGKDGEYFIGGGGYYGQGADESIINYNCPPETQPGLWCQWVIEDNMLVWNGGKKFYNYIEWLQYLIDNFFEPSGYTLNGQVEWQGEDVDDYGIITVEDNEVGV